MLVTIHCFPGRIIISVSLFISRNWLCFECCCVPCNRRGGGGSSSHLQGWNWQILTPGGFGICEK